jgi:hypothetical protein
MFVPQHSHHLKAPPWGLLHIPTCASCARTLGACISPPPSIPPVVFFRRGKRVRALPRSPPPWLAPGGSARGPRPALLAPQPMPRPTAHATSSRARPLRPPRPARPPCSPRPPCPPRPRPSRRPHLSNAPARPAPRPAPFPRIPRPRQKSSAAVAAARGGPCNLLLSRVACARAASSARALSPRPSSSYPSCVASAVGRG